MGVLLTLPKMDRERLQALGASYAEECLDQGMDFLKAAGNSNALAARYVSMLQRLRSPDKHAEPVNTALPENNIQVPMMGNAVSTESMLPYADANSGGWFVRNHGPEDYDGFQYQPIIGSEFMDFNDLLSGTGLPRDVMPVDWVNAGTVF